MHSIGRRTQERLKPTGHTSPPFPAAAEVGARPVASAARPAEPAVGPASRTEWREWPTILSLDAPAVAVLWQWMLARALGVALRPSHVIVLGASVWMAYAADRWFEGWRLTRVFTRRHLFYQRHRWPVAGVWTAVFAGTVALSIRALTPAEFRAGLGVLVLVLLYLFSHQMVHRNLGGRAPKEICVAVLLGAGATLFPAVQASGALGPLVPTLADFMLLCFANCVLISSWESRVDRLHGQTSIALQFRGGVALGAAVPWVLAGLVASYLATGPGGPDRVAASCALASSVILGVLNLSEPRIGRRAARVLADVALMTPVVPLAWSWVR
jgi:hypothetical protein